MMPFLMLWSVVYFLSVSTADYCDSMCNWQDWESWSKCSVSCGGSGRRTKYRALCCPSGKDYTACVNNYGRPWDGDVYTESCNDICFHGGSLKSSGFGCKCHERYFGHCCEHLLPGCTPFPTDVIFVLDSSASQTEEHFHAQLEFVIKFVEHVNINQEEFQIAVVTFSTEAKVEINFNPLANVDTLRQHIRNINFRPGATFTDKGLKAAMEIARNSERRKGMVTLTYAVVLTDGMSNKRADTRLAAARLKHADVHVVAIGIGHEVSHQELQDIASPGNSFSPSYVFSVGDFNALDTILKQLVQAACDECSAVSQLSDILFLLDETNQMSEAEFQLSVDVMTSVVQRTHKIGALDGPRFALTQVSDKQLQSVVQFSDSQMQDMSQLLVKLQTLQRSENGVCEKDENCSQVNITSAVSSIVKAFFKQGGREKSRRFIVVLSNGRFQNPSAVKDEIAYIHKTSNVRLFVIGPGEDVDMNGLLSLAKEANHVYITLGDNDLSKLGVLQSEFSYNNCTNT